LKCESENGCILREKSSILCKTGYIFAFCEILLISNAVSNACFSAAGFVDNACSSRKNYGRRQQCCGVLWKKYWFPQSFPKAWENFSGKIGSYEFYGKEKTIFRDFSEIR